MALAGYPGFHLTAPPGNGAPYGVYTAAYVPQTEVPHVAVLPDGARVDVPPPEVTGPLDPGEIGDVARFEVSNRATSAISPARRVPLGAVARARSGDKGGTANVGVWTRTDEAYEWLVATLTPARVQDLLPEASGLPVTVHPLPNLRAVNVVIDGLLGRGVAASTRLDPQGKAVGEWLRGRTLDIPEALL